MKKEFDKAVFIGRMQIVHNGHMMNVMKCLEIAEEAIVILGSAYQPATPKNPFSAAQREAMLREAVRAAGGDLDRLTVKYVSDHLYSDDDWMEEVQVAVAQMQGEKVALVGHNKDGEGSHLAMFPQWDSVDTEVEVKACGQTIYASEIRNVWFERERAPEEYAAVIPETVQAFLNFYVSKDGFKALKVEWEYNQSYPGQWGAGPFITTDAVVVCHGHVLMVERGGYPGKGNYALPGGFLDAHETIEDGMLRELKEETRIKVPPAILKSNIKAWQIFDHPNRSQRARVITHAAFIQLKGETGLPRVKGGDDAARAFWMPLSQLRDSMSNIYEDHYSIIKHFV